MTENLAARIIDTHTVILGQHGNWVRLSLPWLARDIAGLIEQIRTNNITESKTLDRIPALRFALAKLNVTEPNEACSRVPTTHAVTPTQYHRDSHVIRPGDEISTQGAITYLCKPQDLLNLETFLAQCHADTLLCIITYSECSAMIGPILKTRDYCPLCLSYLAAPLFGLGGNLGNDEEAMRNTALALAQSVRRQANDTVVFDGESLAVSSFVPFIGCPQCIN